MRLDVMLESLYVLSSLGRGLSGPPVCTSRIPAPAFSPPSEAVEASWGAPVEVMAFLDVNVIPMDSDRVLTHQTVLIRGGQIASLGPAGKVRVPAGAVRIDGQGKYLMPGLADMHAHFNRYFEPDVNADAGAPAPFPFNYLANGVTTVRNTRGIADLVKQPYLRLKSGEDVTPRLYFAPVLGPWQKSMNPADAVANVATAYKTGEYNFIDAAGDSLFYTHGEAFDSLMAVARRLRLSVSSHTHAEGFEGMLALGAAGASVEHLDPFWHALERDSSSAGLQTLAVRTRKAGTWIVPTLGCERHRPEEAWPLIKALQDAGVGLLLGADIDGGRGKKWPHIVHEELALMVEAGLTPYQALLTGTRNVAQYLGILDSSGTVAVGKRADLVLLYGNPLAKIRNTMEVAGVMIGGRWLDRATIDQRLFGSPQAWFKTELGDGLSVVEQGKAHRRVRRSLDSLAWAMPSPSGGEVDERARLLATGMAAIAREEELQAKAAQHLRQVLALLDSLAKATSRGGGMYAHVLQLQAKELGAMRMALTPNQREAFDPRVRTWIRWHARQGYKVSVVGVASTP